MIIGIPKEIKNHEYRVGITHHGVSELSLHGHQILIEKGAGEGAGITDEMYTNAGATLVSVDDVFEKSEMIIKVKEPQKSEYTRLKENQILFTYLHLAAEEDLTKGLLDSGCTAIAYETITDNLGRLPLLTPMSIIAGRMSIQAGAYYLQKPQGGKGALLSGAPGTKNAKVVIIGGGVVGINAARIALGMGADVYIFDKSNPRLQEIDNFYENKIHTLFNTEELLSYHLRTADLVIGAVLVPGASAPRVISKAMVQDMEAGSVMVDVAIDQGGCFETSRPTTHQEPVYTENSILHYCVTNMPGAVSKTSTFALTNCTLPYALKIANQNFQQVLKEDPNLRNGLNVRHGKLTYEPVATTFNLPFTPALEVL